MKEMFPHPCPCKGEIKLIIGVGQVVQAVRAVILDLLQVVFSLIYLVIFICILLLIVDAMCSVHSFSFVCVVADSDSDSSSASGSDAGSQGT